MSERRLADALGVPPRNLATLRTKHLRRGVDWELADTDIALTQKSLPALTRALGLTLAGSELASLAQKSRRAELPVPVDAKVIRFPLNRHMLTVRLLAGEATGSTTDLVVTHRDNFKLGMVIPIQKNAAGRFELARRSPRQKGRW